MVCRDMVRINIEEKGVYENFLDEDGREHENLNGVALTDGCYCKHYRWAQDWSDKENLDRSGQPLYRHYCAKSKTFGGWSYCCWTNGPCFEKGKSAGIKRILNKIRHRRLLGRKEN